MSVQEDIRAVLQTRGLIHMQDLLDQVCPHLDLVERAVDELVAEGFCRPYEFAPQLPRQALAWCFQLGGGKGADKLWGPGSKVFWYLALCSQPTPVCTECPLCEYEDSGVCFWHR